MNTEQRKKNKKTQKSGGHLKAELYLKIPYHILNISKLRLAEKVLLAHIYSFGEKGCWQSNETLATMFMVSTRTITQYISRLLKKDLVQIKCSKGYYRTIRAKSHPEVKTAAQLCYRGKRIEKSANSHSKNLHTDCAKNSHRLGRNLLTTNNNTIKENNKETTATPSPPLPKGAPALLTERRKQTQAEIEQFKRNFGKKKFQPMTEKEFQRRKQSQIKVLLG